MNEENRQHLLRIARESIQETLTGEPSATFALIERNPPHELQGAEGAFVTLKRKGISPGGGTGGYHDPFHGIGTEESG